MLFEEWFAEQIKTKLSYASMAFQNNKKDLEEAYNVGKLSQRAEIPFNVSEVYQLIDGIKVDGVEYEHHDDNSNEFRCNFCYATQNEWVDGRMISFAEGKRLLEHQSTCPYTLAVSMNTGRNYDKHPLNED